MNIMIKLSNILLLLNNTICSTLGFLYDDYICYLEPDKSISIDFKDLHDARDNPSKWILDYLENFPRNLIGLFYQKFEPQDLQIKTAGPHLNFLLQRFLSPSASFHQPSSSSSFFDHEFSASVDYLNQKGFIYDFLEFYSFNFTWKAECDIQNLKMLINLSIQTDMELKILRLNKELIIKEGCTCFYEIFKLFIVRTLMNFLKNFNSIKILNEKQISNNLIFSIENLIKKLDKSNFDAEKKECILERALFNFYSFLNNILFYLAKHCKDNHQLLENFQYKKRNQIFLEMIEKEDLPDTPWIRYFFYGQEEYYLVNGKAFLISYEKNIEKMPALSEISRMDSKTLELMRSKYYDEAKKFNAANKKFNSHLIKFQEVEKYRALAINGDIEYYERKYENIISEINRRVENGSSSIPAKYNLSACIKNKIETELRYHLFCWGKKFYRIRLKNISDLHKEIFGIANVLKKKVYPLKKLFLSFLVSFSFIIFIFFAINKIVKRPKVSTEINAK